MLESLRVGSDDVTDHNHNPNRISPPSQNSSFHDPFNRGALRDPFQVPSEASILNKNKHKVSKIYK
jgi:hypothetical protein